MYQGSKFVEAGNVVIGCISPDGRNLLNTIMEDWEKHYTDLKKTFPDKEPSFYGFAYWLVRWSGLIQPTSNNPPDVTQNKPEI